MLKNSLIVYDTETGGKNPHRCQITQISGAILDPVSLEIIDIFDSEVKPCFDDEWCQANNVDPVEDEALEITKKTKEQLEKAPELKQVWPMFVEFVKKHTKGKNQFNAPIRAGFNIIDFDNIILDRICADFKNVKEDGRQNLFHPIHNVDVMNIIFSWTTNIRINQNDSISLDNIRKWLGMPEDGAHNALVDVIDTAEILKRFVNVQRTVFPRIDFSGAFDGWERPKY